MEGEPQKTLLAAAADPPGDVQESLGHDRPAADDADPPALLDHEEPRPIAGGHLEVERRGQAADHELRW